MADQQLTPLHFVVVVLGDVGRSPRMQYHALSLLQLGHHVHVSLVGYQGEDLIDGLQEAPQSRLHVVRFHIPSPPPMLSKIWPLYFLYRVLAMTFYLLVALLRKVPTNPPVSCILVQNPPALPLLAVACLCSRLRHSRFVIDWHNLGYSMLDSNLLRRIVKAYEFFMAPLANGHLTVTAAMKTFLKENIESLNNPGTNMHVLYDCPPNLFQPLSNQQRHEVMAKLHVELCQNVPRSWNCKFLEVPNETILTNKTKNNDNYQTRLGRPALVTSSTSWTPDEDFGVLLDALVLLDESIQRNESTLKVLVVVTGKGPQQAKYLEKIFKLKLSGVAIQTIWLEPGDYPRLLACADLAVSLHTSTSGLDLPMKILDSFGCGVPVCARDFDCLSELVQDGHNGRVFQTATQLAEQLWDLLSPLPSTPNAQPHSFGDLAVYSNNLKDRKRWHDNWKEHALPVLMPRK